MCTIYLNIHVSELDLSASLPQLSAQRRDYLHFFRREEDKRAVAAAWLLLCRALRERYAISEPPRLAFGSHGKPFLADYPHIYFNLSHSRDAAVCAVDTRPVGIDVETTEAYDPALLTTTMNDEEIRSILSDEHPDQAFLRLWTRKEAFLKYLGTGITDDLRDILRHPALAPLHLQTFSPRTEQYICSLCAEGESMECIFT